MLDIIHIVYLPLYTSSIGKHPVSALQEICAKKKWKPPVYELMDCVGSAHKKTFLYRVGLLKTNAEKRGIGSHGFTV